MNQLLRTLLIMVFSSIVISSCNDEENLKELEPISFTFSSSLAKMPSGRMAQEKPTAALISIIDANGHSVFSMERINLYMLGEEIISEPVDLFMGSYKVTDFLLINDEDEILYACPKYGSPMQNAVSKPLPFQFFLGRNVMTEVKLDVLSVTNLEAKDLGYASFNSSVLNPLRIAVFTVDEPTTLTNASLNILHGYDTVKSVSLNANINTISFPGNEDDTYTMIINKQGYNPYKMEFIYSDLAASLDNLLLEVKIDLAFTIVNYVNSYSKLFEVTISSEPGVLNIDYGDGTSEIKEFSTESNSYNLNHEYAAEGNYNVTITGDLDKITRFYSFYGGGMMDSIELSALPNILRLDIGLTRGPSILDLSNNSKLEILNIPGIIELDQIIFPLEHNLRSVILSGLENINTQEVDSIIDNIYNNAVSKNIVNGYFFAFSDLANPQAGVFIGPPSQPSIDKLNDLVSNYNWEMNP